MTPRRRRRQDAKPAFFSFDAPVAKRSLSVRIELNTTHPSEANRLRTRSISVMDVALATASLSSLNHCNGRQLGHITRVRNTMQMAKPRMLRYMSGGFLTRTGLGTTTSGGGEPWVVDLGDKIREHRFVC